MIPFNQLYTEVTIATGWKASMLISTLGGDMTARIQAPEETRNIFRSNTVARMDDQLYLNCWLLVSIPWMPVIPRDQL